MGRRLLLEVIILSLKMKDAQSLKMNKINSIPFPMNIHIYILWGDREIDEVRNLLASRNEAFKWRHDRLVKVGMLHIAPIDEEKLLGTFLPGGLRFPHKALDGTHRSLDIHGYQVAIHLTPKNIGDALAESACP